jgi:uncharacterized protein YkwD
MKKSLSGASVVTYLSLSLLACQPTNQSIHPSRSSSTNPSASALPQGQSSSSGAISPAGPVATPSQPVAQVISNPQNTGPVKLPSEVSADASFRQEVVKILAQLLPEVKEEPVVTEITRQHALQIAMNPKDTNFKVLANYQPVAASGLQTLILSRGKYPSDNLLSAYFSDSNRERLLQRFQQQVSDSLGVLPYTHYGVEVLRKDSAWFISLVLLTEIIGLDQMALTYSGPQNLLIKGQLLNDRFSQPEGLVTLPDGTIEELKLTSSGKAFELPLSLKSKGYYSFEINVTGPLGPQPATNFVLAVGMPYPQPDNAPVPSPTPLPDLTQLRGRLLELINQDRQSMGEAVVAADPQLDRASQSHSEEMIAQGYIGHNSPLSGTPQMQANAFGVSELVAQNIAISRSLENSQRELMSSPGHRKTMIKPDWTHVGLGIAAAPDGFLYITQNFFVRRFEIEPLPAKIKVGETFRVKGKALKTVGAAGIFVNGAIQGNPLDLAKTTSFDIPVTFSQVGKQNVRVGLSDPPVNNAYQFVFYNNWNLEVIP